VASHLLQPWLPIWIRRRTARESVMSTHVDRRGSRVESASLYWTLLICTSALLGLGLLMVLSASSVYSLKDNGSAFELAARQLVFAAVGVLLAVFALRMPRFFWKRISPPALMAVLALLVLVLIFGTEVGGQRNWLVLYGPIRMQPSEFAKLALILWVPYVLSRKELSARRWRQILVPVGLGAGLTIVLVLLERDLGTPMVMVPIVLAMLWAAGAPKSVFILTTAAGLGGVWMLTILTPYRRDRFTSWLDPWADPLGSGMQAVHGQLALGSGGLLGQGLGASKEKWGSLPAAHTDFIMGIIGEELGLVGSLGVLLAISAIVWACLQVALRTQDAFVRYVSVGVAAWIGVQSIVNVGAVIGALPITGVTLPLVSYGGSSLVPTLVAIAVVMSFIRPTHESDEPVVLAAT
jgi:cell division protein FtsW